MAVPFFLAVPVVSFNIGNLFFIYLRGGGGGVNVFSLL